jgi:DNA invertase Pin-like site-specific DNA recombinase
MSKLIAHNNPTGLYEKTNDQLNVAIYPRKSNKSEGRSKSIDEQTAYSQQVCTNYGFDPGNITVYQEEEGQKGDWWWQDIAGRNPKPWRPALTRLMRDVEADKIDVVVVWRTDRLYRDAGVCDALMKIFKAKGIRFIADNDDMDIDSAKGLYEATIGAAANRQWRDKISEDIRRDHKFKMQSGLFTRNPSCYGFRSKGKGSQAVEPIWNELDLVNRIFRLFVHGEGESGPMGINAIANLLMDEGISIAVGAKGHKAAHPERVNTSGIRTILTNCQYIGKFRHNKQEYDVKALLVSSRDGTEKVETAVPVTIYEAAQEKLRLTDRPGKKSVYSEHLLTGLVICAYCGRPLHVHYEARGNSDKASKWFVCNNRKPPRYCKPYGMRMIQEDVLDNWVLSELAPLLMLEIRSIQNSTGRDADEQALASTERKIIDLQKQETQSLRDMLKVFDKEQITRVAADFRNEREQLGRKAEELRNRLKPHDDLPDLSAETLTKMPQSAIKDALRRAVQWIAIGKDGVVILTNFGMYIGATFRDIEKGTYFTSKTRTTIYPPTTAAAMRCFQWLLSPEDFVKGRRASIGRRAEALTDDEILPGIDTLGSKDFIETEVKLVIEDIKLAD